MKNIFSMISAIRLIFIFALCFLSSDAFAQIGGPRIMKNSAGTTTVTTGDTVLSTNTLDLYTESMSGGSKLTVQVNTKKVTGTTSFNTYLEVSADGDASHTWNRVPPTVADTLNGADGDNTIIWTVDKQAKNYRIRHVNSSGTSMVKAWYQWW